MSNTNSIQSEIDAFDFNMDFDYSSAQDLVNSSENNEKKDAVNDSDHPKDKIVQEVNMETQESDLENVEVQNDTSENTNNNNVYNKDDMDHNEPNNDQNSIHSGSNNKDTAQENEMTNPNDYNEEPEENEKSENDDPLDEEQNDNHHSSEPHEEETKSAQDQSSHDASNDENNDDESHQSDDQGEKSLQDSMEQISRNILKHHFSNFDRETETKIGVNANESNANSKEKSIQQDSYDNENDNESDKKSTMLNDTDENNHFSKSYEQNENFLGHINKNHIENKNPQFNSDSQEILEKNEANEKPDPHTDHKQDIPMFNQNPISSNNQPMQNNASSIHPRPIFNQNIANRFQIPQRSSNLPVGNPPMFQAPMPQQYQQQTQKPVPQPPQKSEPESLNPQTPVIGGDFVKKVTDMPKVQPPKIVASVLGANFSALSEPEALEQEYWKTFANKNFISKKLDRSEAEKGLKQNKNKLLPSKVEQLGISKDVFDKHGVVVSKEEAFPIHKGYKEVSEKKNQVRFDDQQIQQQQQSMLMHKQNQTADTLKSNAPNQQKHYDELPARTTNPNPNPFRQSSFPDSSNSGYDELRPNYNQSKYFPNSQHNGQPQNHMPQSNKPNRPDFSIQKQSLESVSLNPSSKFPTKRWDEEDDMDSYNRATNKINHAPSMRHVLPPPPIHSRPINPAYSHPFPNTHPHHSFDRRQKIDPRLPQPDVRDPRYYQHYQNNRDLNYEDSRRTKRAPPMNFDPHRSSPSMFHGDYESMDHYSNYPPRRSGVEMKRNRSDHEFPTSKQDKYYQKDDIVERQNRSHKKDIFKSSSNLSKKEERVLKQRLLVRLSDIEQSLKTINRKLTKDFTYDDDVVLMTEEINLQNQVLENHATKNNISDIITNFAVPVVEIANSTFFKKNLTGLRENVKRMQQTNAHYNNALQQRSQNVKPNSILKKPETTVFFSLMESVYKTYDENRLREQMGNDKGSGWESIEKKDTKSSEQPKTIQNLESPLLSLSDDSGDSEDSGTESEYNSPQEKEKNDILKEKKQIEKINQESSQMQKQLEAIQSKSQNDSFEQKEKETIKEKSKDQESEFYSDDE